MAGMGRKGRSGRDNCSDNLGNETKLDRLELIKQAAEARPFNLMERIQTWMFGDCDFDERYQDD